ncbi:TIGR02530 family flagellar biosynthesis protein [Oceanobacillus sp. CAU 1775]
MDHRIHQVPKYALQFPNVAKPKQTQPTTSFEEVLKAESNLKISKHASDRIKERNIEITDKLWQTIGERVQEAKQKGVTDSLVVLNDAALLVSAKNNTVVTAMDRTESLSKTFTNINGTILING